ncbi:helix-turn-helix transcriptional regulator [Azospirillum canadense]|uniref:helix-turn-helix transcriptional regulator n=1 Tax=Azospirillum canadense TaxID=403962 RepID=UPI0022261585|nr:AraC family transcriptional regulator [Azospirillum canadense]MCW2239990.1 AraC family transcriptional regulator [Azospirillum canadense]
MATAARSNLDLRFIPVANRPRVLVRQIGRGMVGIARVRCDTDGLGPYDRPEIEDAFLVSHHLTHFRSDIQVDGKLVSKPRNIAGLTSIHDYRRRIDCEMHTAFDTMTFHLPRVVLETIFPDSRRDQLEDLDIEPSGSVDDGTIAAMAAAMLPALAAPERISLLFLDHVSCALATHIVATYGRLVSSRTAGTLASWQERRVKEMIAARLDGEIRLADLAAECRLSIGHFVRAFRRTTNTTPHQWLLQRRVEHAKSLMEDRARTLAEIALSCGFADQSHFTRTFTRLAGVPPGVWRQRNVAGAISPLPDPAPGLADERAVA